MKKTMLLSALLPCGSACAADLDPAAKEFKDKTLKLCENDQACVAAVEAQFQPCHEKYAEDWNRYLESSETDEAKMFETYSRNIYSCIVAENGKPYFSYGK